LRSERLFHTIKPPERVSPEQHIRLHPIWFAFDSQVKTSSRKLTSRMIYFT